MENENATIFRQKSIDRISSPEQLHDYIKVSSPSAWFVLTAIIVLLVGVLVWGIFGTITVNTGNGLEQIAPIDLLLK